MVEATYIDADTFSIQISTVNQVYTSGGYFSWFQPTDLTNWTARMHIRDEIDDTVTLVELVSPGDIAISTTDAKITFTIASSVTEGLDFIQGVYDLELVDPSNEPYRVLEGFVTLSKEVTR